eukprot:537359-Pyramimonas_sp.AAC.1
MPYVSMTSDGSTYENNWWVLRWTKYHHGLRWASARAFAKPTWADVLRVSVAPNTQTYCDNGQPPSLADALRGETARGPSSAYL